MAYDPEMDGDTTTLLRNCHLAFGGHISVSTVVVERIPPGSRPWLPRATAIILLDPNEPGSRCGVIDLLHPSEAQSPRCGFENCRCMGEIG